MLEHQLETISYVRKDGSFNEEVSANLASINQQVKVQIVEFIPMIEFSQDFFDEAWNIWNKI
ncbi:hypothetical protein PghCCS26_46600 [Paenibacillus glycanilyticus]|uniref:Uncharacterized protein n=1 Tax=Paenibacillus glycanilyticus TaxID=126569 RepID=A0ABQ6NSL2_9BACL|nr:hypothetical protein [Paenibacillus glycanilyticus]GMK47530.1 hypothetical protein PghCCS26_46600 [Paenibacillus glycanilyticus]